jgi:hypothetical protein
MRCTVFGTGYLGATHAAGMAELGHDVIGVDIDPGKVAKLAAGDIPFYEPGLRKVLSDNLAAGRLRFTTDYDIAAEFADVHFLGVGTPQKKGEYGADLRHVHAVVDALVPRLRRPAVIVGKSTVPVGTAAELAERARELAPDGVDVEVAWNPEFLREGFAAEDTIRPHRLVFGVESEWPAPSGGCVRSAAGQRRTEGDDRPGAPNWLRRPPTPSLPRRSHSSMRWPRCARWPGVDVHRELCAAEVLRAANFRRATTPEHVRKPTVDRAPL